MAGIGMVILFGSIYSIILLFTYNKKFPARRENLTRTIRERAWSGPQVGLLLAGFIGLGILMSAIQAWTGASESPASALVALLLFSVSQILILRLIGRKRKCGWRDDFGMNPDRLKLLPLSLAIYLATIFGLGIATTIYHRMLEQYFGIKPDPQEMVQVIASSRSWVKAGFILLAVIVAPLYEELIFRGVFFAYLTRRIGPDRAMIAVSLAFALIHFHIPSILPLFLLSVILCLSYWRTGSLWTNIGVHALFNGATILFLLLMS